MYIRQIVNNQFEIITEEGIYFQSYDSVVAFKSNNGRVVLGEDYRYSRTTMKYLIQFLGVDSIKHVDREIEAGNWSIDENLRIGDKTKFYKEVKSKLKEVSCADADLSLLFDELKSLLEDAKK